MKLTYYINLIGKCIQSNSFLQFIIVTLDLIILLGFISQMPWIKKCENWLFKFYIMRYKKGRGYFNIYPLSLKSLQDEDREEVLNNALSAIHFFRSFWTVLTITIPMFVSINDFSSCILGINCIILLLLLISIICSIVYSIVF